MMTKNFQLEITPELVEAVDTWMHEKFTEYAAHHGNGYNKKLLVNHHGTWKVTDHGKEVYKGGMIDAVKIFNEISQK